MLLSPVRLEGPAHDPTSSPGNPVFPGLDQAQWTGNNIQQERGCPGKIPLESSKTPFSKTPFSTSTSFGEAAPGWMHSGREGSVVFFILFWGFGLRAFGFFQRGNIFKKQKKNPQNLRTLPSSCEFPISCCTRTWHRKILSKFLLKNNKKTRKTHQRLSLPDTARQEGLTELLRSIGPIIHKLRQIYCTWQILTAPKKPSLSPGA